jgi:hypothetical protein
MFESSTSSALTDGVPPRAEKTATTNRKNRINAFINVPMPYLRFTEVIGAIAIPYVVLN